jgi:hypothetical protein
MSTNKSLFALFVFFVALSVGRRERDGQRAS